MKAPFSIRIPLIWILGTCLHYSNSEQHLLERKNVFGIENQFNLFDPYIVLRRCPQLRCLYSDEPDLKPLCNTISSYELKGNQHVTFEGAYENRYEWFQIYNLAGVAINVYQIDHHGKELFDKKLQANERFRYNSFAGAAFRIKDDKQNQNTLMEFVFSGYGGKVYVSACELPSTKVEYFDPDDEYLNIFVSPSLTESFFWWKRALLQPNSDTKASTTIVSVNSYLNLREPASKWHYVKNTNRNHKAPNNFKDKYFHRILRNKNALTVGCATNLFDKIQWRRPRWSAVHRNIFNYDGNSTRDAIEIDLMYVSEDKSENTTGYLTISPRHNILDENFKLLYPKSEYIHSTKSEYSKRIFLQKTEMFNTKNIKEEDDRSILSIDFNAFSLENIAARTLRYRLPELSLASINALHDCMCFHICNDDFDEVAAMPEKDRLRYKNIVYGDRYPLRKEHRHFHAIFSELNIDILPYDSANGFPINFDNDDVLSSKYQLSWDNFWFYWDIFKDYDVDLLLNAFDSFHGTFSSQFCSSLLHYSHPIELQEDVNQAMDVLNMKTQKKPKMVTISLSNAEEAPTHDTVFIEKHIVDNILQEDPEKNDGSLSIHGKKIRLIYSSSFEYSNRLHGKRATHWPEYVDRSWKRVILDPNVNLNAYGDYDKPIAIHHDNLEL